MASTDRPSRLAVVPEQPTDPDKRIELAVSALRSRIDEEFKITERFDSKARQMFAVGAGFFAVAQAVTFGAFRQSHISGIKLVSLLAIAALAVAALVACGHHLANAEEPDKQADIKPAAIERWAREHDDHDFGRLLVQHLRDVAEARANVNKKRFARYGRIEKAARFALIITAVELGVGIAFRL